MTRFVASAAVLAGLCLTAPAADPTPPPGFTAVFNGKDFTGLRGYKPDFSPAEVAKLPAEERDAAGVVRQPLLFRIHQLVRVHGSEYGRGGLRRALFVLLLVGSFGPSAPLTIVAMATIMTPIIARIARAAPLEITVRG